MDTSQPATTPINPNDPNMIVGGAFGGTIPTASDAIAEAMPSFSFDESEFDAAAPVAPTPVEPAPVWDNLPSATLDAAAPVAPTSVEPAPVSLDSFAIPEPVAPVVEASVVTPEPMPSFEVSSVQTSDLDMEEAHEPEVSFDIPAPVVNEESTIPVSSLEVSAPVVEPVSPTPSFDVPPMDTSTATATVATPTFDIPTPTLDTPVPSVDAPVENSVVESVDSTPTVSAPVVNETPISAPIVETPAVEIPSFEMPTEQSVEVAQDVVEPTIDTSIQTPTQSEMPSFETPEVSAPSFDIPIETPVVDTSMESATLEIPSEPVLESVSETPITEPMLETNESVVETPSFEVSTPETETAIPPVQSPIEPQTQINAELSDPVAHDPIPEVAFDLPVADTETSAPTDEIAESTVVESPEATPEVTTPVLDTPVIVPVPVLEETSAETHEETENTNPDTVNEDPTVVDEQLTDEVQEVYPGDNGVFAEYRNFVNLLDEYLTMINAQETRILWSSNHKEEVYYKFTRAADAITIYKENTTDTLVLREDKSGLEVIVNDHTIAHYGVEEVNEEWTNYFKRLLNKLTFLVQVEVDKINEASKQELRALREIIKTF